MSKYREKAAALAAQMNLEEKVGQTLYTAPAVERLGIPSYNWWNEALHGVARAGTATVFPQAVKGDITGDNISFQSAVCHFNRKGSRHDHLILHAAECQLSGAGIAAVEAHEGIGKLVVELAGDILVVDVLGHAVVDIQQSDGVAGNAHTDIFAQGTVDIHLAGDRDAAADQAAVHIAGLKYINDEDIAGKFDYKLTDTFMGFHCGNTPSCKMCADRAVKYQLIQHRLLEPAGSEPDFTRGTLEGDIAASDITFYRLQCDSEGNLRAYIAQGEVLPVATRSFGGIGIFAIPEMGRFYRHVLIQKRYPHHGAVAFGHYGKALFEVFKFLGIGDIAYNQPDSLPYPTENPWG